MTCIILILHIFDFVAFCTFILLTEFRIFLPSLLNKDAYFWNLAFDYDRYLYSTSDNNLIAFKNDTRNIQKQSAVYSQCTALLFPCGEPKRLSCLLIYQKLQKICLRCYKKHTLSLNKGGPILVGAIISSGRGIVSFLFICLSIHAGPKIALSWCSCAASNLSALLCCFYNLHTEIIFMLTLDTFPVPDEDLNCDWWKPASSIRSISLARETCSVAVRSSAKLQEGRKEYQEQAY